MKTKIKILFSFTQNSACYVLPSFAFKSTVEGSKKLIASSKKQGTYGVLLFFIFLNLLVVGGCTSASGGESETMRKMRAKERINEDSELIRASYFFYPSTMRMVNIDNMPNWNEAIKDVRRLSVFSMWPDRFKVKEVAEDLKVKENFSLYAEMEEQYSNFKLLGREDGTEAIFMYSDTISCYVFHLLGKLDYVKLMKLSADLRDEEKRGTGITYLLESLGNEEKWSKRRRKYQDRRKEKEAAEQLKKDSIEAAQATETVITE